MILYSVTRYAAQQRGFEVMVRVCVFHVDILPAMVSGANANISATLIEPVFRGMKY